ncbi:MAG: restriction endonuclease subunit S [Saccharofermentanales bacterium]|jgi:type I restriction enzyme S subunit|nr:restriction endonuclease subunit S [Bacillota bacterium]
MTPQELKNSILQLAIQGKLVEQRKEEGTGEELYQQIQKEKAKLIKEGKIKKEKPLPEITEDEIPFDIPESWKWVRLGDCSSYSQTKKKVSPSSITPDLWLLDLEDIEKDTGKIINYRKAGEKKIAGDRVCFDRGQLLYSKLRPYLKKVLLASSNGICTPELVPFSMYGNISHEYMVHVLKSPHIDYTINSVTYGVKMPRVGTDTMVNLLIPIPPQAEQKRIVEKIEEFLSYIDCYEEAWNKLEDFNERFPTDMQKSLLQYAIQGKLVEQRDEEGTGEELYQQIQKEKEKLIKEGKIKKEKPLPEITEDEVPFDIPENWKWIKLGNIVSILGGKRIPAGRKLTSEDTGHKYIRVSDMKNGTVLTDNLMYVPKDIYPSISRYTINKEDVYITVAGTIGTVGTIPKELDGANLTENADRLVFTTLDKEWLVKCLQSSIIQSQIVDATTKVGQPKLAIKRIREMYIPLPPLAEQRRIVAKLEEILLLCEKLK